MNRCIALVLLAPFSIWAGDGLYTHTVAVPQGPIVHQLVQDVTGNSLVQDEFYLAPSNGITRLIHTTRGGTSGTNWTSINHSALTWFANGGEVSNFWVATGPMERRTGGYTQIVVSNRIHSYSQKLGSTQPKLWIWKTGTNILIHVQTPIAGQFEILESTNYPPTNWHFLAKGSRPLGTSSTTNVFYDRPATNSHYGFYRARSIFPLSHPAPTKGGPFTTVIGPPAWLPDPHNFDPPPQALTRTGPPVPQKKK